MSKPTTDRPEDIIAQECVAVRLRMLNRVVSKIYDDTLRPLGVRASQLNILVATAKFSVAHPVEICDRLQLDASTLSRNVERMKAKAWLVVVPSADGRAQPFRLTAKGRRLLQRVMPLWNEAQQKVNDLLGAETLAVFDEAAQRVRGESSSP